VALLGVAYVFRHDVGVRLAWPQLLTKPVVVGTALTLVFYFGFDSTKRGVLGTALLAACQIAAYLGVLLAISGLPQDYSTALSRIWHRVRRPVAS
jgi:hypothetical protein